MGSIFKVAAIVQARMGSTRLTGKVLKDLGGETVLARVVNRTRRATLLDEVVVATSVLAADDAIVTECKRLNVAFFRGDEVDVLDRYYRTARECSADYVVRITADCPLIDWGLIDATIHCALKQKADYATNSLVLTYPRGLDVEVFTSDALKRAWSEATAGYQRTHVTTYFYENPQLFKVISLTHEVDLSKYRWTLDTIEDLETIRAIYEHFENQDSVRWTQVLDLMKSRPELVELNSKVRQKTILEG